MTDLIAELAEVAALFSHATPNDWQNDGPNLFTDTRVQVCCGRGYNECCGSPDVDGSVEEIGSVIDERDAPIIAAAVNFLRTHHAEIEAMARDAQTEREIQNAARDLPEGYTVTIYVEKDSGYIDLTDPGGDPVCVHTDDKTMAEQIAEATKAAMHDTREGGES